MRSIIAAVVLLSCASPIIAAKPPGGGGNPPPANPQIAYRFLNGRTVHLMVANENGTNAFSLYNSQTSFAFDLAPRAQQQIAIVNGTGASARLYLLSYEATGFGTFATTGVEEITPARQGSRMDFSPDGTKIAYSCCFDGVNEKLAVYDLTDDSITHWATGTYFWDIAWYRGGTSIAYSTMKDVYELTAPNATPQHLFGIAEGQVDIDSARTDNDALVISYNDTTGAARIGLWKNGSFTNSDLANSARSWQGTLNCNDQKLAYLGVQNNSGSQAFYIRELQTGATSQVSKNSNILLQFWPTC
jgi:hypothetical protein